MKLESLIDPCLQSGPFVMYEVWDPRDERDRVGLIESEEMDHTENDRFGMSMVKGMESCLGIVLAIIP